MTRSHVAFGPSYILIALVRGPSQTYVLARTVARTCVDGCTYLREGLHVLAWRDAMCCLTLPQTLALFASNACPLCRKRYHPPPQTLSSVPANVIIRPCKRYHPLLQTLSSAPANVIIRPCKRYHPPLQTLSSAPANVIIRSCKRYHPPPQTFASDSGFFFRVTMSQVWSSFRSVDFVLDRAVCVGRRKDVCNISFAGGRSLTCILCGEQNLHKWQSSRNFVPYYIYKKKYIWIHSNSFAV